MHFILEYVTFGYLPSILVFYKKPIFSSLQQIVNIQIRIYGRSTGQVIIFCSCGFYLLSFLFSLPILSGHRLDVYHTSTHDVALVQI